MTACHGPGAAPVAAVVGLGLIGTSAALGWRRAGCVAGIRGIDPDPDARAGALARGAVDEAAAGLEALDGVDLVLLAAPPAAVLAMAEEVAAAVPEGAVVTDACSVKAPVVARYEAALAGRAAFVGGHPMAGSAGRGPAAADPDLFRGRSYVLTPTAATPPAAPALVEAMARALGARPVRVGPEIHDRLVARVSHLPQVVASCLMLAAAGGTAAAGDPGADEPDPLSLAGPGLRDVTRIAGSPGQLWAEILLLNADQVLAALADFEADLSRLREALRRRDAAEVRALIDAGAGCRRRLEALG